MIKEEALYKLKEEIKNPKEGLPEDIFLFISSIIPMVNVDLLIQNEYGHTLLAWRDDIYCGAGWHIPGGMIRFQETMEQRIIKVSETEIGPIVEYDLNPIALNQVIEEEKSIRGHFISILYRCFLSSSFVLDNKGKIPTDAGYLKWHKGCPDNLLKVQDIYREFF